MLRSASNKTPGNTDPVYCRETRLQMYTEQEKRFPVKNIGRLNGNPTDILTGTFGASAIVAVYGIPIRYEAEQWPTSEHQYLSEEKHGQ